MNSLIPDSYGAIWEPVLDGEPRYRYRLWRIWDDSAPRILFIMLNPSTADELDNDPTVERCERRAAAWGFGSVEVVNIFAYRATSPEEMKKQTDPVGKDNDFHILQAVQDADMIVCAWGVHGKYLQRTDQVIDMLGTRSYTLYCLGVTSDGAPRHPLYVGYDVKPTTFLFRDKKKR